MALEVFTRAEGTRIVVTVSGEVDVSNAQELRDALGTVLESDANEVEVDLSEVPYIDSTGIGVLVGLAHKATDAGIQASVTNPQRNVGRVLSLLGLTDELHVDVTSD